MKDIGIATYIDNVDTIIEEFGWLYRSWKYSGAWQNSQIVAFYNPAIDESRLPKDYDVWYIPSVPFTQIKPEWAAYPFLNSVYILHGPEAQNLSKFKYVMRTDNDVFLTPNFRNIELRLAKFGMGMYASEPIVSAKLAQIAAKWGIKPVHNNVGSTFICNSDLALLYGKLQFEYCMRLAAEEFGNGKGEWPNWYFGVLTMYAGNLAANALFGYGLTLGGLDCHCMSQDEMCSTDYHIHAWHTYDYFSKFHWREGAYNEVDMAKLNPKRISDYCLLIAGKKV